LAPILFYFCPAPGATSQDAQSRQKPPRDVNGVRSTDRQGQQAQQQGSARGSSPGIRVRCPGTAL
jgi:hypothetical protein